MIKVNLQNTAVQNMLTGQNTLDSVFIDGNSILFIEKPEYLKQLYRDEIKARAIKVNLKVAREEIHKRTQDDRYNNLDDMETLKKLNLTEGYEYYMMAVAAARVKDVQAMAVALQKAIQLDPQLKERASTDKEFYPYAQESIYLDIVD